MLYSDVSDLPLIEEQDAMGEVAQIYADFKRELQIPFVSNMMQGLAISSAALTIHWDFTQSFFKHTTIPQSLTAMILFAIAETGNCGYCSAGNELTCRMLGIDEEMLSALVKDLGNVSPERIQAIIRFALKASHNPQQLVAEDYARVREQGITDEELVEIILIAAIGNYNDTLADALKIEVDSAIADALGR